MALPNSQTWGPWFKSCSSLKTRQFSNVKLETSLIRHWPNNFFYATMVEKMSSTLCTDRTIGLYKKVPFKNWAAIKTMTRTILDKSKFRLKLFSFHLMLLGWLWKTGSGLKKSDNFIIFILVVNSWVLGSSGLLRQIGTPQSVLRRSGRHGRSSAGARPELGWCSAKARPAATRRSSTKKCAQISLMKYSIRDLCLEIKCQGMTLLVAAEVVDLGGTQPWRNKFESFFFYITNLPGHSVLYRAQ